MSYYDCWDEDDCSDEEIYYHNYSVDYANQILTGQHSISCRLPRRRRRRCSEKLVRVSTLDRMPIAQHEMIPALHSRPKYVYHGETVPAPVLPPSLPSLEETSRELETRATHGFPGTTQPISSHLSSNNESTSENQSRPLSQDELWQVQQQQEAFQQHLLNLERRLTTQAQQRPEQEENLMKSSDFGSFEHRKRPNPRQKSLHLDEDQAEIARLIEGDPYIAAAMEDFAYSHGLLTRERQRSDSDYSSSKRSRQSYLSSERSRDDHSDDGSCRSSKSSSSPSSQTGSEGGHANLELILLRELHAIRRLIEQFVRSRTVSAISHLGASADVHYRAVEPATDYRPALVPRERPAPRNPVHAMYENVVNAVRQVIDRRSPSQREQPLKPSEIDPKLKHVYMRPSQARPLPRPQPFAQPSAHQKPSHETAQETGRPAQPTLLNNRIPTAPPYESLAKFSSGSPSSNNRDLSYGNRQRQTNVHDQFIGRHSTR